MWKVYLLHITLNNVVNCVQGFVHYSTYKTSACFCITTAGRNCATHTSPCGENAFEMFDGIYHWRWQHLKIVWECVFNMHDPSFWRWAWTGESIISFENAALDLEGKIFTTTSCITMLQWYQGCMSHTEKYADSNTVLLNICETLLLTSYKWTSYLLTDKVSEMFTFSKQNVILISIKR